MPDVPSSNLRTGGQIMSGLPRLHGVKYSFLRAVRATWRRWTLSMTSKKKLNLWFVDKEGGVSNMAEAWGKMTGKPGIGFVTRGPGATNASIGIHTAQQTAYADFIHWSNSP